MSDITARLTEIKKQITTTATMVGRNPESVRLVAVSKTHPASHIITAYRAGHSVFGENYVQELLAKVPNVTEPVEWHFIGHLQSNKVRHIAPFVTTIHSVDRLSLAEEISRQYGKLGKVCNLLIQVNVSGELTKSGTTTQETLELVRHIALLPNVKIIGLMTMPPFFDDPEAARPYFGELKKLADEIGNEHIKGIFMDELSMGMSGDFKVAIEEGATLVRIGTAIFGQRG